MNFWVNEIKALDLSANKYSQCGDEIIIDFIFKHIKPTNKYLVDLGAGNGEYLSNTKLLRENGWGGLMIDMDNGGNEEIKKENITAENIVELFEKHEVPKEFDLLSIDLDGNDIYILEKILEKYSPKLIVTEFNRFVDKDKCVAIEYNPNHQWSNDTYYGYSFMAGKKIAKDFGYGVIYNHKDLNLYLLKGEISENIDYNKTLKHRRNTTGRWVEYIGKKPTIMPFQWLPFNGDSLIAREFLKLKEKFGITTAIETGTAMGGTTKFLSENFDKVYTIEINKLYQTIAKDFVQGKNVDFVLGDSAVEIKEVLKKCDDKMICLLDSHWLKHCPLQDELTAIAESGLKPIIAIHDFVNPYDTRFGYDFFNGQPFTYEWLKPYFEKIFGENNYEYYFNTGFIESSAKRGIIYILPK